MAINEAATSDPRGKVISQFKVFWNDPSPKQVVVLQFPNRDRTQPYNNATSLAPLQIRMKPVTGLVEVDIPLNSLAPGHFNKEKAIEFGSQLARNKVIRQGGNFGLAGGFGAGGANIRHVQGAIDASELPEDLDAAYAQAVAEGKALNTLTLTGKIQQFREGDPIYAMATFKGGTCDENDGQLLLMISR